MIARVTRSVAVDGVGLEGSSIAQCIDAAGHVDLVRGTVCVGRDAEEREKKQPSLLLPFVCTIRPTSRALLTNI